MADPDIQLSGTLWPRSYAVLCSQSTTTTALPLGYGLEIEKQNSISESWWINGMLLCLCCAMVCCAVLYRLFISTHILSLVSLFGNTIFLIYIFGSELLDMLCLAPKARCVCDHHLDVQSFLICLGCAEKKRENRHFWWWLCHTVHNTRKL